MILFTKICLFYYWIIFQPSLAFSTILIKDLQPGGEVDPRFLSVAIDSHLIAQRWKNFDFSSKKVLNMAKALSPAFLRIGGTAADLLNFQINSPSKQQPIQIYEKIVYDNTLDLAKYGCFCATDREDRKICEYWPTSSKYVFLYTKTWRQIFHLRYVYDG